MASHPKTEISVSQRRALTAAEFHRLASVPTEAEWFANIDNKETRRAYRNDLAGFMTFTGIDKSEDFRLVTRAHVIAWRKHLEELQLAGSSIRRKLAAISSLYEYMCEKNAVDFNPVKGAKRPKVESYEGKTPALGDGQVRALLAAPDVATLKGMRDRALLSVFLYHGLRREELCKLKVRDIHARQGVQHLRIHGKGRKLRYIPVHPGSAQWVEEYLAACGHGVDPDAPLFCTLRRSNDKQTGLSADGVFKTIKAYATKVGIDVDGFGPHSLRATAATNALERGADIAKVQEWLGHTNIQTTRMYDRRGLRPQDSPTFKVAY